MIDNITLKILKEQSRQLPPFEPTPRPGEPGYQQPTTLPTGPETPSGGVTGGGISDRIGIDPEEIKRIIDPYLEPIRRYYQDAMDAAQQTRETMTSTMNTLQGETGLRDVLSQTLEPTVRSVKQKASDLKTGTGFLGQFVRKTQAELANRKIPQSPKSDLGEPAGLRQRVNTKGFYR